MPHQAPPPPAGLHFERSLVSRTELRIFILDDSKRGTRNGQPHPTHNHTHTHPHKHTQHRTHPTPHTHPAQPTCGIFGPRAPGVTLPDSTRPMARISRSGIKESGAQLKPEPSNSLGRRLFEIVAKGLVSLRVIISIELGKP